MFVLPTFKIIRIFTQMSLIRLCILTLAFNFISISSKVQHDSRKHALCLLNLP